MLERRSGLPAACLWIAAIVASAMIAAVENFW